MKYLSLLFLGMVMKAQPAESWKPLEFLTGEWVGDTPGACSFTFDLQHKILIRKSYAESQGSRHDDLMVVYFEKDLKAIYFDNEGHVIRYTVESSPDWVRFVNDQYRLTYRKTAADQVIMDFEIAPPGKPFSNYLHATLRRK